MNKVFEMLKSCKIIAVIKTDEPDIARDLTRACAYGGIKFVEILMGDNSSLDVLEQVSAMEGITAGAGTVLSREMAEKAYNSGARFIVSPHTDPEIIHYSKSRGLVVVPGAATSSEIVNAWKLGADMVKIFPASQLGGPGYIKALRKPLGFIDFMATGGITPGNMTDYFKAGVSVAGISGALSGGGRDRQYADFYRNVRNIVMKVEEFAKYG